MIFGNVGSKLRIQNLKNLKRYGSFKGCLPKILLHSFLNILTHTFVVATLNTVKNVFNVSLTSLAAG